MRPRARSNSLALLLVSVVGLPATAWAAGTAGRPGPVLFGLAALVLVAKLAGIAAERLRQPSVLGELLAGIGLAILVPPLFGLEGLAFVRGNPTLHVLAEVGVLLLLFEVGLEADLRALAHVGLSAGLVATLGIVTPFVLGWGTAAWFLPGRPTLAHVFVGATLTATSVGITARVLRDLGVTRGREGQIVLGAAILDDVLGLVVLAVVNGLVTAASGDAGLSSAAIAGIVLKAALFLTITVAAGSVLSRPLIRLVAHAGQSGMLLVVGLALCFTLAFVAELVGLAGIIGAFAAGLFLDPYGGGVRAGEREAALTELLQPLAAVFVPLFFVLMGIQVDVGSLANREGVVFGIALVVAALLGKLACALGVVQRGVNRLAVAIGMVPRGEVGLIFAGIGAGLTLDGKPLLTKEAFSAVVLMVLATTLITPIALRWALGRGSARQAKMMEQRDGR